MSFYSQTKSNLFEAEQDSSLHRT